MFLTILKLAYKMLDIIMGLFFPLINSFIDSLYIWVAVPLSPPSLSAHRSSSIPLSPSSLRRGTSLDTKLLWTSNHCRTKHSLFHCVRWGSPVRDAGWTDIKSQEQTPIPTTLQVWDTWMKTKLLISRIYSEETESYSLSTCTFWLVVHSLEGPKTPR